jgi:hypothetical protein
MPLLKRLQNPFVLVGQGFAVGAVIFFATHPGALAAAATQPAPTSASR